jgi:hypothetical protein
MHTLNAATIADQIVTDRVDTAARARRFARVRQRSARAERRAAHASPLPTRLDVRSSAK